MPKLEKWALIMVNDPVAQMLGIASPPHLVGVCTGHKEEKLNKQDGKITTSPVIFFDPVNMVAETMNTRYDLGEIEPEWAQILASDGNTIEEFAFDVREQFRQAKEAHQAAQQQNQAGVRQIQRGEDGVPSVVDAGKKYNLN